MGLIGRGDGGSRLLLLFLKSASRIICFYEINKIWARYSIHGDFFWPFDSPSEEGTAGIIRVLVPNNYG